MTAGRLARYDYLVVGAGLFGATVARRLADAGRSVLVLDSAEIVGGMAATAQRDGQLYQLFGGHIFHTNDRALWQWVTRFAEFKHYSHHVYALAGHRVYSLPINLTTLDQVFGDEEGPWTVARGRAFFAKHAGGELPADTIEAWCRRHIGPDLYELLIRGYTAKQWGRSPAELPAEIVRRLPLRATWDSHYFSDEYQGLPVGGYTSLVENMLDGIDLALGEDYCARSVAWNATARRVIYTGPVDRLFNYRLGRLEYRSLRFQHYERALEADQGCATLNFCDETVEWLREEEWRHWWRPAVGRPTAMVTRTLPDLRADAAPMYPLGDLHNRTLFQQYAQLAGEQGHLILGGRLGTYRYLDMHQAIASAHKLADRELSA